jgi:hypothetical protein
VRRAWAGLWTGFALGMAGVVGSVVLGIFGHPVQGGFLGGTALVGLVSVFVIGTASRRKERITKAEVMTGAQPASANPRPPPT